MNGLAVEDVDDSESDGIDDEKMRTISMYVFVIYIRFVYMYECLLFIHVYNK